MENIWNEFERSMLLCSTVRLCPTRASRSIPGLPPCVSAGMAECRVGLRQISFGLLPPAGSSRVTRSLGIWQQPPLWVPDERRGRITEAVNPANEVIDVRRVGTRPVAFPLLHDSQQCLRQGHRPVTEVEEVV